MLGPNPAEPLQPRLMAETTRSRYARLHKVASLLSLLTFLGFLLLSLQYRGLSYALLGAALALLVAAAVLKALLIKGIPLKNDLATISNDAASEIAKRPGQGTAQD